MPLSPYLKKWGDQPPAPVSPPMLHCYDWYYCTHKIRSNSTTTFALHQLRINFSKLEGLSVDTHWYYMALTKYNFKTTN